MFNIAYPLIKSTSTVEESQSLAERYLLLPANDDGTPIDLSIEPTQSEQWVRIWWHKYGGDCEPHYWLCFVPPANSDPPVADPQEPTTVCEDKASANHEATGGEAEEDEANIPAAAPAAGGTLQHDDDEAPPCAAEPDPDPGMVDDDEALSRVLAYARHYRVFPANAQTKAPRIKESWKTAATSDPATIRRWFKRYPGCVWGVPTGKANRIVCLDLDRKDGKDGKAWLDAHGLDVPATWMEFTPNNGEHHLFRYPRGADKIASKIGAFTKESGIDIKADGGYFIAWHLSAEPHEPDTLAEAPEWLLSAVAKDSATTLQAPNAATNSGHRKCLSEYEEKKVMDALAFLPYTSMSQWQAVCNALATYQQGIALVNEWTLRACPDKHNPAENARFMSSSNGTMTVGSLYKMAVAEGWQEPKEDDYGIDLSDAPERASIRLFESKRVSTREALSDTPDWMTEDTSIGLESLKIPPPPAPMIIDGLLAADICGMVAPGGAGKSTLTLQMLIHIILAIPFLGRDILKPGPGVIVTKEDDLGRIRRRAFHICQELNLSEEHIRCVAQNLHVVDLRGTQERLANLGQNGNIQNTKLVQNIISKFKTIRPSVISFDPCIKFGPGEEKGNDGMDAVISACQRISDELKCATHVVHHVAKAVGREGIVDVHAGRGGSAFGDGCRCIHQLVPDRQGNVELHVTKITDAKPHNKPFKLKRDGMIFPESVFMSRGGL